MNAYEVHKKIQEAILAVEIYNLNHHFLLACGMRK